MPRRREGPAKICGGGIRGRKPAKHLESNEWPGSKEWVGSITCFREPHPQMETPSNPMVLQKAQQESTGSRQVSLAILRAGSNE